MAYMYSVGLYEAHRKTLTHIDSPCQANVFYKPETIQREISPWWHLIKHKEKEQKFPTKPKTLIYVRQHKYSRVAPWCTYLLRHPETLPASAMSAAAERFNVIRVVNQELFEGINATKLENP